MRSIRTISEERSGIGGGLLSAYLHEHSPQFTRIWTRGFSSAENCGTLDTESTRDGAVASPPVPTTAIRPRIVDMASCSLPRRRCDLERIPRGIDLQTQIALAFRACSLSRLLSSGIKQFEENKSSFHLPSIPTDLHPVPQHTPLITQWTWFWRTQIIESPLVKSLAVSFLTFLSALNRLGHAVRRGSWLLGALEVCTTLSTTLRHAMFVHDLEQELWWRAAAEPFCEIIPDLAKNKRGFGGGTRGRGEGEAAIHC